ncbi:MAG: glycosyltransferase [Bacteroidales bacterium]|jgi:sugar transferase (PEP-CTERM/EpsH1 system associated)
MKIFVLLPRVPFPLVKGDKLRAYNQIKYLAQFNEIHLCALNDTKIHPDAINELKTFCKSITVIDLPAGAIIINLFKTLFNGLPFQVGYFFNKRNFNKINILIDDIKPDRIYCQLIRVAEYVKHQKIRKTLDYQDVFSKGMERRITSSPFYFRPFIKAEHKRLLKYEAEVFDLFDNKTIISYPDREFIQHPDRNKIVIIPNGVDTGYYKPFDRVKEYDLLFTGNMGYPPNINSAEFLIKEILPLIRKEIPKIKILIAGTNPSIKLLSLKSENVIVTGWVKDMREAYARSKIFIAPMLIGTGMQNKLLEAMAMKLPSITSELANSAIGAVNGKEILTANQPEEYAEQVLSLLKDNNKMSSIGEQGFNFVIKNFKWENVNQKLNQLICS